MVFGGGYGSRIVRSYAGSGTAETIYETEDGGCWKHDPMIAPSKGDGTVPNRIGVVVGNRVFDR